MLEKGSSDTARSHIDKLAKRKQLLGTTGSHSIY